MKKNFLCGIIGPQTDRFLGAKKVRDRGFKQYVYFISFSSLGAPKAQPPPLALGDFTPGPTICQVRTIVIPIVLFHNNNF